MSRGCVPRLRTSSTYLTGSYMNITTTSGNISKICRRSGTGVGRLISASQALPRLWPRDILAQACLPIAKAGKSDEDGNQNAIGRVYREQRSCDDGFCSYL